MFRLQHGDELVFQPPSGIKQDEIMQDLTMDHPLLNNSNHSTSKWKRGEQRSSGTQENKDGSTFHDSNIRKLMHRDIERQRRQEMTNLHASLRSLVPLEYLKGKKSISDHMQETVNYITNMQENIKNLRHQRDKLKLSNSGNVISNEDGSSTSISQNLVTVNSCRDGVEILISSSLTEEGLPLSRVLVELLERGLNCSEIRKRIY
ncbi:Transcription factor bHLH [Abeliophyllum distichum]|uniref:Transcription factor bHLH n=1 Tax=Abeliophyllum distichum TaxID=126358 RepID=A0ABD1VRX7_9LAMI